MNRADDNQYIADLKYLIEEEIKWLIGPVSIFLKYAKICKNIVLNLMLNIVNVLVSMSLKYIERK